MTSADELSDAKPKRNPNSLANLRRGRDSERELAARAGLVELPPETTLFEDMCHVRRFPKSMDVTPAQKDCRLWKEKDIKGFMAKWAELEAAQRAAGEAAPNGATEQPDAGSERVEALIGRLLEEMAS